MLRTALRHRLNAYRNPVYIVYTFLGVGIFLLGQLIVAGGVGNLEIYLFRFFNSLPGLLNPIFVLISLFGTIGFVIVATFIALIRKHYSHAIKFLLAGGLSWFFVKWLKTFEYRARPSEILPNVNLREQLDSVIGYPSGHAAVATSLGVIAYLYTPKKFHPFVTWIIILVCVSRLFLGMHLPLDVIGGFGVGLAIASVLNFIFGDTQGKFIPTKVVKKSMHVLHVDIKTVERASVDARGSTPFFVTLKDGSKLFVKVVDTTNNVADWLFKLTRKVLYRRLEDEAPFMTPKRQLEHEAYVAGLAFSNGILTPKIRGIFHVKEDMWAMAQEMIPGKSLDKVAVTDIDHALLVDIWTQVKLLHNANIVHRDLRAANIFLDSKKRPWIIDFGFSEASVPRHTFHRDTVELLASLSCTVEVKDVVTAAETVMGRQELEQALPYLDYASLSGATTKLLKSQKGKLEAIIQAVKDALHVQEVKTAKVKRLDKRTLLYIVIFGLALYVFIPQLSDLQNSINSIKDGNIRYLGVALLCSILTYPAAAGVYRFLSFLPLNYMRTLLITLSTSFTSRLLPASTGAIATNVRYLQKSGYNTTQASSLVALNNLVGLIGHLTILFIVAGLSGTRFQDIVKIPVSRTVFIIAGLVLLGIIATILIVKNLRKAAKKIYISTKEDLTKLFEKPDRFFAALLSAMTITTMYALSLYASAHALGVDISIMQALYVFTVGVTAASVTPTPGGIGGAEAGLVAGFVSIGVPTDVGVSVALVYRLITFWLPILPGFIAFHFANKSKYI